MLHLINSRYLSWNNVLSFGCSVLGLVVGYISLLTLWFTDGMNCLQELFQFVTTCLFRLVYVYEIEISTLFFFTFYQFIQQQPIAISKQIRRSIQYTYIPLSSLISSCSDIAPRPDFCAAFPNIILQPLPCVCMSVMNKWYPLIWNSVLQCSSPKFIPISIGPVVFIFLSMSPSVVYFIAYSAIPNVLKLLRLPSTRHIFCSSILHGFAQHSIPTHNSWWHFSLSVLSLPSLSSPCLGSPFFSSSHFFRPHSLTFTSFFTLSCHFLSCLLEKFSLFEGYGWGWA